jgi:hypothetical protein
MKKTEDFWNEVIEKCVQSMTWHDQQSQKNQRWLASWFATNVLKPHGRKANILFYSLWSCTGLHHLEVSYKRRVPSVPTSTFYYYIILTADMQCHLQLTWDTAIIINVLSRCTDGLQPCPATLPDHFVLDCKHFYEKKKIYLTVNHPRNRKYSRFTTACSNTDASGT